MHLQLFSLFTLAALASAKISGKSKNRALKPKDIGKIHTSAFDSLGKIIDERENMTEVELMMEVSKISSSYCPKGDAACEANAYKATLLEFERVKEGSRLIKYPQDFDGEVKALMNKMHRTLRKYDGSDHEKVMETLYDIENELENMKDVDVASQATGLATISVALESTKLWTSAHEEKSHPLHRVLVAKKSERKLQTVVYENVILADVNATLANSIALVGTIGTNNPFTVFALPPIIFISVIQFAIAASTVAAYSSSTL